MLEIYEVKVRKNDTWLFTKQLGEMNYSSTCTLITEGSNLLSRRPFAVGVLTEKDL